MFFTSVFFLIQIKTDVFDKGFKALRVQEIKNAGIAGILLVCRFFDF